MKRNAITLIFLTWLCAFGEPASAEIARYEKESPITLKGDSKFTISQGWSFDDKTNKVSSPEGDLTVFLLQEPFSGKVEDIAAATWKSVNKSINYKILQTASPPATNGWEQVHQVVYDVPAAESKIVLALIRVYQGTAYIMLVDGANAAMDKRGAQFQIIVDTWRPNSMKKEDLSQRKAKQFTAADEASFDRFIEHSLADLKIPGTAVAVIQDGRVVYRKGFGVKKRGTPDKVEPETLFMIGSTTKPLTTLMLSKLVEQGKFSWDTPIISVLPQFSLADKELSKKVLVKHTACACTGMPRRDMEEVFGSTINSADDMLKQLHTMIPTTGFGETFQYSNQLVAAGGYAGAYVYNKDTDLFHSYESVMNDLVFKPLKMTSTRVRPLPSDEANLAFPHAKDYNGVPVLISKKYEDVIDTIGPAGCVWSNVDDLCKYVLMELRKGKDENGNVLFSEEQILKRRTPGVKVDDDTKYGLGLYIETDKGAKVIHHAGNTMGFSSHMMFLPENGIGMVILSNASGINGFRNAMKQKLLEVFLAAEPKSDEMIKFSVKNYKEMNDKELERLSLKAEDLKWINAYIGYYKNNDLGPFEIAFKDGKLQMISPRWTSEIGSVHEPSGKKLIGLVSPPWWIAELQVQKDPQRKLILDAGQTKYELIESKKLGDSKLLNGNRVGF